MKFESYRFQLPDGIDTERYVRGTYRIEVPSKTDILDLAKGIAAESTTGTWVETPGETEELKKKYAGKVTGVYETPDYENELPENVNNRIYIVNIDYPVENIKGQIPLMLSTVVGNVSCLGKVKLLDISFPEAYLEDFKGPKFGIEGVRDLLDIPDRPIVCNMIKPDTGFTPEEGAEMFYKAARGGCDVIKDDELLGNPEYCKMEDRITKYMEKVDQVEEETGEKTLYAVNITDRVDKVLEKAQKAVDLGVNALMLNSFTVGLSTVRAIAEDSSLNVPLLGHIDFSGAVYSSPVGGVSSQLYVGKLQRLAGTDLAIAPAPHGKFPMNLKKCMQIFQNFIADWGHINKVWYCGGGGMHPGLVPRTMDLFGYDCCIASGGAVHGHPMGAEAGAKALRQAIDSRIKGVSIAEYREKHEELNNALDEWGIATEDTDLYREEILKINKLNHNEKF